MPLTHQELNEILELGHESRGVEFKGSGDPADKAFRAKVIRAILGMANRRDGGYVILGIDDSDPSAGEPGLSTDEEVGWTNHDDLATWIGEYADPAIEVETYGLSAHSGNRVAVIEVSEFDDVPVLCRRDFEGILRRGALYTRSHARPETSDSHRHSELREALDLAIDKGVRRFVERARRAGLRADLTPSVSDADQFDRQAGDDLL